MSTATTKTRSTGRKPTTTPEPRRDPYTIVTDAIVSALEKGCKPWAKSWNSTPGLSAYPLRATGERYRGINTLILWMAQMESGFSSAYWMTYNQANELGAQVRKGSRGTQVVFYGTARKDDEVEPAVDNTPNVYRFLKTFTVFNVDQIDNLPEKYLSKIPEVIAASNRNEEIDAMMSAYGVEIRHGGDRAFYSSGADAIQMPHFTAFHTPELYYATLFHEAIHSTKAKHRLDRDFGAVRWGDDGYAKEELVAELGAAFIGAQLGFPPEHIEDHASYLASWIKVLREDKRVIFTVAAKAQAAADYVMGIRTAEGQ